MTKLKNKIAATTIVIFFVLSMTASITLVPNAYAHSPPWDIPTFSFLSLSPNPAGIGQSALIAFWLNIVPPTANGAYGDRWQFTLNVTTPSGTTSMLGPFTSDPAGSSYTTYAPSTLGNYTFQMFFPGQTLAGANPPPVPNSYSTSANIGDYFEPSNSSIETLVVQQQPATVLPQTPLPTGYWQNPIDAQNGFWSVLAGNWLGTGISSRGSNWYNSTANYNAYTTTPLSAHILWTKPIANGGVIGGEYGSTDESDYYMGSAYEPFLRPPIIIGGTLYYDQPNPPRYGFYAVNLRNGQQIYYNNGTAGAPATTYSAGSYTYPQITCGQVLNYITPNQYGGIPTYGILVLRITTCTTQSQETGS